MKDNFSRQSDQYARYRPDYPAELYAFLLERVEGREAAWDCATGNGQTAFALSAWFKKVFATDISGRQIEKAKQAENIFYSVQAAEETGFAGNSFDLVTVSQALHWLDFGKFFREVERVTVPGGWLAAWMYSLPHISPEIDELVGINFYKETIGSYWDYERKYVDDCYRSISFPFEEIPCPDFYMHFRWTAEDLEGYLNTWSAVQKFMQERGYNPVTELMQKIRPLWQGTEMKIGFPLTLRMGRIRK